MTVNEFNLIQSGLTSLMFSVGSLRTDITTSASESQFIKHEVEKLNSAVSSLEQKEIKFLSKKT